MSIRVVVLLLLWALGLGEAKGRSNPVTCFLLEKPCGLVNERDDCPRAPRYTSLGERQDPALLVYRYCGLYHARMDLQENHHEAHQTLLYPKKTRVRVSELQLSGYITD